VTASSIVLDRDPGAVPHKPKSRKREDISMKFKLLIMTLVSVLVVLPLYAQKKEAERLQDSGTLLKEILGMPEGIPKNLLDKSVCVIVFPSVKKFAIGIGGSYGRGVITCRNGANFTGAWSAPAMFALEGGNIGLQLGGQATDFVLLVMNEKGADSVMGSKVKLGADAAAAAGPKGRDAAAATDIVMKAEILSYSRSKGLFAGVSLEGSTLRSDGGANENLYGNKLSAKEIVREGKAPMPPSGRELINILNRNSPKHAK
jgi:lipid-binding SYLF domain-containing protein